MKLSFAAAAFLALTLSVPAETQAAPDDTLGVAILAANVDITASLVSGSGATGVSKLGTGDYRVDFDRDVSGCYYSATNSGYFNTPLKAVALPKASAPKSVEVFLFNSSDTSADGSFYLLVYCAR